MDGRLVEEEEEKLVVRKFRKYEAERTIGEAIC